LYKIRKIHNSFKSDLDKTVSEEDVNCPAKIKRMAFFLSKLRKLMLLVGQEEEPNIIRTTPFKSESYLV